MSEKLKVIDLFAGVGGLSLGASKAFFEVTAAVEIEKRALDSHAVNFPSSKHINADVSSLDRRTLMSLAGIKDNELTGIIGGPPCQGFSTIGKGDIEDTRNRLFFDFFRLVDECQPAFFLAENVPGILNSKYANIREQAKVMVEGHYDLLEPILIKASDFGAATTRTRVFFIGVRKDVKGIENIVAKINSKITTNSSFVKEALLGLPVKISDEWKTFESSWRKVANVNSSYLNNINKYVEAVGKEHALNLFDKKQLVSGSFGTKHAPEISARYANLSFGQMDTISKSTKLRPDGFCPTLRAGTDSSRGSYQAVRPIHPTEARVITPREAARLQGFPDWFQFHETKWHSFRQIGNSVCPIAAEAVFSSIKESIRM